MKKLFVIMLAMCVVCSLAAFAQEAGKTAAKTEKAAGPPLKSLVGTISQDGKSFTNDADKKSWAIVNPDKVMAHAGMHVKLSAHVYADKNQVHVMTVAMAAEKAPKGEKAPAKK